MHRSGGVLAGGLVALVLGAWLLVGPGTALERLAALTAGPWFPVALLALYLVRGGLGWPVTLCSALVGYRYGVAVGLPLALVGAVGTTALTWAVARRLPVGDGWVGRLVAGGARYFESTGGVRGVAAARLAPTPAAAVSAAAGAAGVGLRAFVAGTLVGVLPWTVAAVTLGASLESVTAAGTVTVGPTLVVGCALAAVLLLVRPAARVARERGWLPEDGGYLQKGSEQS